jgi:excisionase family DNA binding protein
MTVAELAEYLSVTSERIRYEIKKKRIPHVRIGRTIRFMQSDIDLWIARSRVNWPSGG